MTKLGYRLTVAATASVIGVSGAARAAPPDLPPCSGFVEPGVEEQATVSPSIGQEREVEVGGVLFSTDLWTVAEAGLRVTKEATVSGTYAGADFVVTIPPVTVTPGDVRNGMYAPKGATFRYLREKHERGSWGPTIGIVSSRDGKTLNATINFGLKSKDYIVPNAEFEQLRCVRPDDKAVHFEILYGGTSKGTLTLQYREYAGNTARPAFSQDATFDLSEGNEIGFKGVRFRIIKTSNLGVRYVVSGLPGPAALTPTGS